MMKEKQINPELAKSKINEKLTIKKIVFHEFQIPDIVLEHLTQKMHLVHQKITFGL